MLFSKMQFILITLNNVRENEIVFYLFHVKVNQTELTSTDELKANVH